MQSLQNDGGAWNKVQKQKKLSLSGEDGTMESSRNEAGRRGIWG